MLAYQLTSIPDAIDCAGGDGEACAWMAAGFIPGVRGLRAADNMADAAKATSRGGEAACKISSFVPGTKVLMADDTTKPIEDIRVGDKVLATDPVTGESGPRTVVATITTQGRKDLVKLTIDSDGLPGDKTGTVVATANHPVWRAEEDRWIAASDLDMGDILRTVSGAQVELEATSTHTRHQRVHNLTVEGIPTYYVLADHTPVLVHNCGGTVWDDIKGTQPAIPGTGGLPKSFEMTAGTIKVWVHGNASKHIAEYAESMTSRGASPEMVGLGTQQNLRSLQAAVGEAGQGGLSYDRLVTVGGWELKFGAPRQEGMLLPRQATLIM